MSGPHLIDRVQETTTVEGTGTMTLLGAVSGFQGFAAVGNANTCYYAIVHRTAFEWEVGVGTYTASGTLLSRDSVLQSSNSNALVNFSAGTKDVFITAPGPVLESALHNNVAGEIAAITEKTAPVAADLLLIEDSAASNAKKKLQVGNLPAAVRVVTAIPSSPANGDTILLRLGSTPFEFVQLTYDATYGKWVSQAIANPGNGVEVAVTTTSNTSIAGVSLVIGGYKSQYDAGLRLQGRITGRYNNNNTGGTTTVNLEIYGATHNVAAVSLLGSTTGATSPGGTTDNLTFDSGWQDFSASNPGTDTLALIIARLTRNTAGTAAVLGRQSWLRWVHTPA